MLVGQIMNARNERDEQYNCISFVVLKTRILVSLCVAKMRSGFEYVWIDAMMIFIRHGSMVLLPWGFDRKGKYIEYWLCVDVYVYLQRAQECEKYENERRRNWKRNTKAQ